MNLRKDHYRDSFHTNLSQSPLHWGGALVPDALSSGAARRRTRWQSLAGPTRVAGSVLLPPGIVCLRYLMYGECVSCRRSRGACSRSSSCEEVREGAQQEGWARWPLRSIREAQRVVPGSVALCQRVAGSVPPPARGTAHCHSARPPRQTTFFLSEYSLLTVRGALSSCGLSACLLQTVSWRPQLLPFAGKRDNSKRWITRLVCR